MKKIDFRELMCSEVSINFKFLQYSLRKMNNEISQDLIEEIDYFYPEFRELYDYFIEPESINFLMADRLYRYIDTREMLILKKDLEFIMPFGFTFNSDFNDGMRKRIDNVMCGDYLRPIKVKHIIPVIKEFWKGKGIERTKIWIGDLFYATLGGCFIEGDLKKPLRDIKEDEIIYINIIR